MSEIIRPILWEWYKAEMEKTGVDPISTKTKKLKAKTA